MLETLSIGAARRELRCTLASREVLMCHRSIALQLLGMVRSKSMGTIQATVLALQLVFCVAGRG
jgi:hypothetical protein